MNIWISRHNFKSYSGHSKCNRGYNVYTGKPIKIKNKWGIEGIFWDRPKTGMTLIVGIEAEAFENISGHEKLKPGECRKYKLLRCK